MKGAGLSDHQLKSEIQSTKCETNSNDKNPNVRNSNSKSDNHAGYLRIRFVERHIFKETSTLIFFVLVILELGFRICFEFRYSYFEFLDRRLFLTGSAELSTAFARSRGLYLN